MFTASTNLPEESVPQEIVQYYEKQMGDYLQCRKVQALLRKSKLKEQTRHLPTKVFLLAAQDIDFEEVSS